VARAEAGTPREKLFHSLAAEAASQDMRARHHKVASGGNLRAAVFGVNDGLVSNGRHAARRRPGVSER
jgi:hypothetical protein